MDKYYQMLDAKSVSVSSFWKVVHVSSMIFATVSGFVSAYTLSKALDAFNDHCILFANIVITNSTELFEPRHLPQNLPKIDFPKTDWGAKSQCYFCQFTPVMSMISGIIWGSFFVICSKGGAGYISDEIYRPWRIVYPAIIFTVTIIGILLLSTMELYNGINHFCSQFVDVYHTTECTDEIDNYTLSFNEDKKPAIIFLEISIIAALVCLISWIVQLLTLILRIICSADFEMYKITVIFSSDSEEILQGVLDPDNLSFTGDNLSYTSKASNHSKMSSPSKPSYLKRKLNNLSPKSWYGKLKKKMRRKGQSDKSINLQISASVSRTDTVLSAKQSGNLHPRKVTLPPEEQPAYEQQFIDDPNYSSLFFFGRRAESSIMSDTSRQMGSLPFVPHLDGLENNAPSTSSRKSVVKIKDSNLRKDSTDDEVLVNEVDPQITEESDKLNQSTPSSVSDTSSPSSSTKKKIDKDISFESIINDNPGLINIEEISNESLLINLKTKDENNTAADTSSLQNQPYNLTFESNNDYDNIATLNVLENLINAASSFSSRNYSFSNDNSESLSNYRDDSITIDQLNLPPRNVKFEVNPARELSLPSRNSSENVLQSNGASLITIQDSGNRLVDREINYNDIFESNSSLNNFKFDLTSNKRRDNNLQESHADYLNNIEGNRLIFLTNETNQTEEGDDNELKENIIRIYMFLWLAVVLKSVVAALT